MDRHILFVLHLYYAPNAEKERKRTLGSFFFVCAVGLIVATYCTIKCPVYSSDVRSGGELPLQYSISMLYCVPDLHIKFIAHNLKALHRCHVCNYLHTKYVDIFMICPHAELYMPSLISSLSPSSQTLNILHAAAVSFTFYEKGL
jgi:hypothetical protein